MLADNEFDVTLGIFGKIDLFRLFQSLGTFHWTITFGFGATFNRFGITVKRLLICLLLVDLFVCLSV